MHICIYMYTYLLICINSKYICVLCVWIHACICMYIYVFIYVCMHGGWPKHTHTHTNQLIRATVSPSLAGPVGFAVPVSVYWERLRLLMLPDVWMLYQASVLTFLKSTDVVMCLLFSSRLWLGNLESERVTCLLVCLRQGCGRFCLISRESWSQVDLWQMCLFPPKATWSLVDSRILLGPAGENRPKSPMAGKWRRPLVDRGQGTKRKQGEGGRAQSKTDRGNTDLGYSKNVICINCVDILFNSRMAGTFWMKS